MTSLSHETVQKHFDHPLLIWHINADLPGLLHRHPDRCILLIGCKLQNRFFTLLQAASPAKFFYLLASLLLTRTFFYFYLTCTVSQLYDQPPRFTILLCCRRSIFSITFLLAKQSVTLLSVLFWALLLDISAILKRQQFQLHCLSPIFIRQLQGYDCYKREATGSWILLDVFVIFFCSGSFKMSASTVIYMKN